MRTFVAFNSSSGDYVQDVIDHLEYEIKNLQADEVRARNGIQQRRATISRLLSALPIPDSKKNGQPPS